MRLIDADAIEYDFNIKTYADNRVMVTKLLADKDTIDAMPTVEQSRWIPCSERLPEKGTLVVITNDKGNVRCGQYRGVWSFYEKPTEWVWRGNTVETVIAWMPLPEPYKAESEDKE